MNNDEIDVPDYFAKQVMEAIEQVSDKSELEQRLRHIMRDSFIRDNDPEAASMHDKQRAKLKSNEYMIDAVLMMDVIEHFDGDAVKAEQWLQRPVLALGGLSAMEHCTTYIFGNKDVEALLNKLRHGMTA